MIKRNKRMTTNITYSYGLVVMTPASHAGGPGFDPLLLYNFYVFNLINLSILFLFSYQLNLQNIKCREDNKFLGSLSKVRVERL